MKKPTIFVGDVLISNSENIALYDDEVYRGNNFIYSFKGQEFQISEIKHLFVGWLLHDARTNRWFYLSEKMFSEKLITYRS